MTKAIVYNIQKFSIHDGPGIRTTVFFKGCPLRCVWCHNPESQTFKPELMINWDHCTGCGNCVQTCKIGAITVANTKLTRPRVAQNYQICSGCGRCIDSCVANVRQIAGKGYEITELMFEIEKDRPFYEQSGGGVTFSGGEPLSQIDFLTELAKICRERGLHVTVDTCGHVPWDYFERILHQVNLFLFDLKLMDPIRHQQFTSVDNSIILENARRLSARNANISLRIPLIDGINTSNSDIDAIIEFIHGLWRARARIQNIHLLPYHDLGRDKYGRLGRPLPTEFLLPPTEAARTGARLNEIRQRFEVLNYQVKIGG